MELNQGFHPRDLERGFRGLVMEGARMGIRVNMVAPGAIDPTGISRLTSEQIEETGRRIPLGRVGRPAEVAEVLVFLASHRASYVTGVCLPVDGGVLARSPFQ